MSQPVRNRLARLVDCCQGAFAVLMFAVFVFVIFALIVQILMPLGQPLTVLLILGFTVMTWGKRVAGLLTSGGVLVYACSWPALSLWGVGASLLYLSAGILLWGAGAWCYYVDSPSDDPPVRSVSSVA